MNIWQIIFSFTIEFDALRMQQVVNKTRRYVLMNEVDWIKYQQTNTIIEVKTNFSKETSIVNQMQRFDKCCDYWLWNREWWIDRRIEFHDKLQSLNKTSNICWYCFRIHKLMQIRMSHQILSCVSSIFTKWKWKKIIMSEW